MNKLILLLFLVCASAFSESYAAEGQSGWKGVLNDVSSALSSTNPSASPAAAPPAERIVPKVPKPVIKKIPLVTDVLKEENRVIVMPDPPIDEAEEQLAPNTRRILDNIPRGVGNEQEGIKGHLSIKRSSFDESGGIKLQEDESPKPQKKSKMNIKISKKMPEEELVTKLDNARKALLVGQYEASIALYKEVLKKDKKNYDALFGIATAYQKSGQRTQARVAYTDLFATYPNDEAGLNNFLVLAAKEAPEDALTELNKLAIRNPNFASIYSQKSLILSKIGDKGNAISNMAKALKLSPKNNVYRYNLAVMLDDAGSYEDAASVYKQLLEENYKGNPLPVERSEILERLNYISSAKVRKG